ncbi:hypothetical protein P4123_26150, partial [Pseudomonas aeruginosa]|nr:hypothetical protein [Pseudomonas aeruginosa]
RTSFSYFGCLTGSAGTHATVFAFIVKRFRVFRAPLRVYWAPRSLFHRAAACTGVLNCCWAHPMAADQYHHGVRVEINDGTRPVRTIATAIIGLVATADDADATAFPLDTPVLITNVQAASGKAGTGGTLAAGYLGVAGQAQRRDRCAVRVKPGEDEAATNSAVADGVAPMASTPA